MTLGEREGPRYVHYANRSSWLGRLGHYDLYLDALPDGARLVARFGNGYAIASVHLEGIDPVRLSEPFSIAYARAVVKGLLP